MARPTKYNQDEMIDIIERYIEDTELPIFKEVCYKNNWYDKYVYEMAQKNEELSNSIKKLIAKKEVELERGGITGKYNHSVTIFSLKQLGWKDKQDDEIDNRMADALNKIVSKIKKKEKESE